MTGNPDAGYWNAIRRAEEEDRERRKKAEAQRCASCGGLGWVQPDVPAHDPRYGKPMRCPACSRERFAALSGLNDRELTLTPESIKSDKPPYVFLRALLADVLARPSGWLVLWGSWGTAKTLFSQIVVAEMIRRGVEARFIRALQIEQAWFRDMRGDVAPSSGIYRTLPVVVADEAEKVNYNSDFTRAWWEDWFDFRYRGALAERPPMLTIFTLNGDPYEALPGAIYSRMNDGRFCRQVADGMPLAYTYEDKDGQTQTVRFTVEKWGQQVIPGIVHVAGDDARPYIRPGFVAGG